MEKVIRFQNIIKGVFNKYPTWILIILFTVPTFISLLRPGFYTMHDDIQAFRVHQMDKCIQDLQIPCRWVPDMGYQYGYPQFHYYPPSIYYLAEAFHLLGFQFIDTIKIIVILGLILSSLFVFLFLHEYLKDKWAAFVGAILYSYAPYKAVDIYVRGAFSEFWSLVIFPLIFWRALKLLNETTARNFAFFALSVGLLLTTHNLMTFMFVPVAGVWILSSIILEKKWKAFFVFLGSGLLGLGLAAFFTLPVLVENKYVHLDSILSGYFDYRLHFTNLNELFISNFWGYGSSQWGPYDDMSLSTGQIHWIVSLFALILGIFFFKKNKKKSTGTIILSILVLTSLFLSHQKSAFIWERIEFLKWLQFPWRFLANSVFLLSLMGGISVFFVGKFKNIRGINLSIIYGLVIILSLFFLYGNFFKPHTWLNISDKDKFSGKLWEKQLTVSIFDYLPIFAHLPPSSRAPFLPEVMDGVANFKNYEKGSNFQKGRIEVIRDANIRLPLFYFPGMVVLLNDKEVSYYYTDCRNQKYCLGLISLNIPKGRYLLEVRLTDTLIRRVGNLVTLGSIIILLILTFGLNIKKIGKKI